MILMILLSIQKIAVFCESYKKHHVSYPVVMSSRNLLSLSDIWMMSPEMLIHVSFVWESAFQVPKDDKRGACSTHYEEYCDNFPQKFPTCDAIWFTDFLLSRLTTSHMFDICFNC